MLDSRVLCDQQLNERMKQRFASLSDIVNELKKTRLILDSRVVEFEDGVH
jgi:hypothetical protein